MPFEVTVPRNRSPSGILPGMSTRRLPPREQLAVLIGLALLALVLAVVLSVQALGLVRERTEAGRRVMATQLECPFPHRGPPHGVPVPHPDRHGTRPSGTGCAIPRRIRDAVDAADGVLHLRHADRVNRPGRRQHASSRHEQPATRPRRGPRALARGHVGASGETSASLVSQSDREARVGGRGAGRGRPDRIWSSRCVSSCGAAPFWLHGALCRQRYDRLHVGCGTRPPHLSLTSAGRLDRPARHEGDARDVPHDAGYHRRRRCKRYDADRQCAAALGGRLANGLAASGRRAARAAHRTRHSTPQRCRAARNIVRHAKALARRRRALPSDGESRCHRHGTATTRVRARPSSDAFRVRRVA